MAKQAQVDLEAESNAVAIADPLALTETNTAQTLFQKMDEKHHFPSVAMMESTD